MIEIKQAAAVTVKGASEEWKKYPLAEFVIMYVVAFGIIIESSWTAEGNGRFGSRLHHHESTNDACFTLSRVFDELRRRSS